MSLAVPTRDPETRPGQTRDRLVAALATVPEIVAYRTAPDQATAGAAWPKWIQTTYSGPLCTLAQDIYEILLTLPAAYLAETVDAGDTFRDRVALALSTVSHVTYAEPALITFQDRQAMPGLRFRINSR